MKPHQTPSALWQKIMDSGVSTLSVMGMCKNTGKTVMLNHLLEQGHRHGLVLGLTSIGRDGEARDAVFDIPKPAVMVWTGALVATAEQSLCRARAHLEVIQRTGIDSPMGEIVVVRVLSAGSMEVAGASNSRDQVLLIDKLKQQGSALVILDGALGRSQHASPSVAEATILATGAALINSGLGGQEEVIMKTRERVQTLTIPAMNRQQRVLAQAVMQEGGMGLWDEEGQVIAIEKIPTINAAAAILAHVQNLHSVKSNSKPTRKIATIACSGAIGPSLWRVVLDLAKACKPDTKGQRPASQAGLQVLIRDATKLFIEPYDMARLHSLGGIIRCWRPIRLLALSLNPSSPKGDGFDPASFLEMATAQFHGLINSHTKQREDVLVADVVWQYGQKTALMDGG